ncbi:MAG: tetratricopeptide repeat protein, partial [Rubrobacter sp.]
MGETHATVWSLIVLGTVAHHHGDHERGAKLLQESLALSREGYAEGVPFSLNQLGIVAYRRGEYEQATALLKESLVLHRDLGNGWRVASVLEGLAEVACARGNHERATRLFGAGEALHETIAAPLPPCERADYDRGVATARAGLDERSFDAAWTQGRAMTPEQAVEYALGEVEEPTDAPPTTTTPVVPEPPAGSSEKPVETVPSRAKAPTPGLRIFALGPARVEKGGRPLDSPDWTHKPRELLFYLLSNPPRSKEQIGLALWPDASSSQLRSSFHDTLFRLRRALGDKEWISFEKGRYAFNRSLPYSLDVEAFEENLSEAKRLHPQAPERAIGHLEEAVGLYGGDFLEENSADREWAMVRQEELKREYQEALLLLG